MADELKPCPFCGGGASNHSRIPGAKCCAQCGAIEGGWRGTAVKPIGWNTRPIEDALRAEVARLKAELAKYTEPLTTAQVHRAAELFRVSAHGNWQDRDAAIRAAREGAGA